MILKSVKTTNYINPLIRKMKPTMHKYSLVLAILLCSFNFNTAFSMSCSELLNSPKMKIINERLNNPEYKVFIFGRHGKASQINKFSAKERSEDPAKVTLDKKRPLAKKGQKSAMRLAELLSNLDFFNVAMWGSIADRVQQTAQYTIDQLGQAVRFKHFTNELYYVNVPKEMERFLTTTHGESYSQVFFWGHGKSTLELFKKLTGAKESFLPTSGVMILTLKANSWDDVLQGKSEEIDGFAWSPNDSHVIKDSDVPMASLEGTSGLEAVSNNESFFSEELIESLSLEPHHDNMDFIEFNFK